MILMAIALLALLLRLYGSMFAVGFHPDERHIVMVVNDMRWPDLNPRSFAYGSLPFYILYGVTKALAWIQPEWGNYDGCFMVGRKLSALFGAATVFATGVLVLELCGSFLAAVAAALLLAANPFHIQNSHFYTVDGLLTMLVTFVMVFLIRSVRQRDVGYLRTATILSGLAFSTKLAALTLILPVGMTLLYTWWTNSSERRSWLDLVKEVLNLTAMAILASFVTMPYAVLDFQTFYQHIHEQSTMVAGLWVPPYTIQYQETLPFLYHLDQMLRFTIGPMVATASAVGLFLACTRAWRSKDPAFLVFLTWAGSFFLSIAGATVKFPRYLLPIYPTLMICAAFVIASPPSPLRRKRWLAHQVLSAAIVLSGLFYGFRFISIYNTTHTWMSASTWIYATFPAGTKIIGEHWDDKIPLSLPIPGGDPSKYAVDTKQKEIPIYEHDSPQKWVEICETLAHVDVIALPTARTYGAVPRRPSTYPTTIGYYRALFDGSLGFSLVYTEKVRPTLFGLELPDELGDESLSVYDHPKVIIFRKDKVLSAQQLCAIVKAHEGPFDWKNEWPHWMTLTKNS